MSTQRWVNNMLLVDMQAIRLSPAHGAQLGCNAQLQ